MFYKTVPYDVPYNPYSISRHFYKGEGIGHQAYRPPSVLKDGKTSSNKVQKYYRLSDMLYLNKTFSEQAAMTYRTGVVFGNYTCKEYTDGWKYKHFNY